MDAEVLTFICFVAGVSLIVNAEATVLIATSQFGLEPLQAALACAGGQTLLFAFLYRYGGALALRWGMLQRQVSKTRERHGKRMQRRFLWVVLGGASVGVPPMIALATLASSFRVGLGRLLVLAAPLRLLRFWLVALLGFQVSRLWELWQ